MSHFKWMPELRLDIRAMTVLDQRAHVHEQRLKLDLLSVVVVFGRRRLLVALLRLVETFKILDIPLSMLGGGPGSATDLFVLQFASIIAPMSSIHRP